MLVEKIRIFLAVVLVLLSLDLCFAGGFGVSPAHGDHSHHHHCDHGLDHHHHHDHDHHQHRHVKAEKKNTMFPEELAEEEDLKLYGFGPYRDDHDHQDLSSLVKGKPSKAVVDSLALFGAGAMLGDAFLHQVPHAFGGDHSHSHDDHVDHAHHSHSGHDHVHAHSLKDLSVGLSILAGIVLFLLVEKLVRYVEDNSGGASGWNHAHHHHHHKSKKKSKNDDDHGNSSQSLGDTSNGSLNGENATQHEIRKRKNSAGTSDDKSVNTADGCAKSAKTKVQKETSQSPSNLVFGYLNLFSDGVVGDFGILVRSGFCVSKALFFNFLSALLALAGTAVALLLGQDPGQSFLIEGFTAGGFIYIAVAGVLSEMNNNSNTTLKSTAVQLISPTFGIAVALCISLLE